MQIVLLLQAAEYIEPAFDVCYQIQSESHYGRDLLRDYNFSCLTDIHIFLTCSHVTVIVLRSSLQLFYIYCTDCEFCEPSAFLLSVLSLFRLLFSHDHNCQVKHILCASDSFSWQRYFEINLHYFHVVCVP